jgi:hypothetical protein
VSALVRHRIMQGAQATHYSGFMLAPRCWGACVWRESWHRMIEGAAFLWRGGWSAAVVMHACELACERC